ncbi:hypothetical protein C8J57DRAFT_1099714 [Mycena rebaudengoi]|nr:hypothetical protein C8J57DRAFT_1099714 [Mycena rebaudengoi]
MGLSSGLGIHILHHAVAIEAMHDSADSYPQLRCHPETRTKILAKLLNWCTTSEWSGEPGLSVFRPDSDSDSKAEPEALTQRILWLHGPAGAGKSALMRTVSTQLADVGHFGGSFFFKRGHATRGNSQVLFATLAYQLALRIPQLKSPISEIVEDDPSVVGRSMDVQMQRLILDPCRSQNNLGSAIILIDGLDECEDHRLQKDILRLIAQSIRDDDPPLKFLIASRPECHIREMFENCVHKDLYHLYNVEQSFQDVRTYFRNEFVRIRREHVQTMAAVPLPWPSEEIVDRLVSKSSGYFIYAVTVIKFVDDENFRPTERLECLWDESHSESPFGPLDQLYTQILSTAPARPRLIQILGALDFCEFDLSLSDVEQLLELNPGDVRLALRNLHSVLNLPKHDDPYSDIGVHHASFRDFLNDPTRAGEFYVGGPEQHADLARRALKALSYKGDNPSINCACPVAW